MVFHHANDKKSCRFGTYREFSSIQIKQAESNCPDMPVDASNTGYTESTMDVEQVAVSGMKEGSHLNGASGTSRTSGTHVNDGINGHAEREIVGTVKSGKDNNSFVTGIGALSDGTTGSYPQGAAKADE